MLKIAVMGPESTGKSSITQQLARHYKTIWVPEFARVYCERLIGKASFEDELQILKGQIRLEESYLIKVPHLLFCDTMFLTVKIYSEHMFNTYPKELDVYILSHQYDFFLIMDIDLPWEEDPLREFPDLRAYFLKIHIQEIEALKVPYVIISGLDSERLQNSIKAVDGFLKKKYLPLNFLRGAQKGLRLYPKPDQDNACVGKGFYQDYSLSL